MIGLGSNRLTVCRRGGMSVTQAGRGGMEWLGSRGPSWASPYSAQATAALKDAFTAAQWEIIKAYGQDPTNARYIDWINEDYLLVCSLIPELGITRWIGTTDVNQFFITDIKQTASRQLVEKAVVKYDKTGVRRLTGLSGNGSEYWGVTASNTFEKVTASQNDISKKTNTTYTYTETNSLLKIFAISDSGSFSNRGCYRNETELYLSGNLVRHYIPFKRNGKMELLDLVDMGLCTRVGSLAESFDDAQGNPWSPPNHHT